MEPGSESIQCHGVLPTELDKKLCHVLIEQQKNQIEELESELQKAQSKILQKEAELQALKDCVRRLTEFSLSTVSGGISFLNTFNMLLVLVAYRLHDFFQGSS